MNTVVSNKDTTPTLSQDVETVSTFMAVNGGYVLAYQKADNRYMKAGAGLAKTSNGQQRTDLVTAAHEAEADKKRLEGLMVKVHKNPEDWTVADLEKLKKDPKSADMFQALVRVGEAMYGNTYSATIKDYLKQKLKTVMPDGEVMSQQELDALMKRVQLVSGRKFITAVSASETKQTGAVFDAKDVTLDPMDNKAFDPKEKLSQSGVTKDNDDAFKGAPLETLVANATKALTKGSISVAA